MEVNMDVFQLNRKSWYTFVLYKSDKNGVDSQNQTFVSTISVLTSFTIIKQVDIKFKILTRKITYISKIS